MAMAAGNFEAGSSMHSLAPAPLRGKKPECTKLI
jgi:hypothetical protein